MILRQENLNRVQVFPHQSPDSHGLQRAVDEHGAVPLSWAATTATVPDANLGDALSPIIVSVMSGRGVQHRHFDDHGERMVAVGTIGHAQRNGIVHYWGTVVDDRAGASGRYVRPRDTDIRIHALRGPYSAQILAREGERPPEIFGDPVWFLPKLLSARNAEPKYELGVVVHISELVEKSAIASVKPELHRYEIPPSLQSSIRIINTYASPTPQALFGKIDEILSCRRIASTSFHGLVIAETFGIPCVWFAPGSQGGSVATVDDLTVRMDARVRDFYAGAGQRRLPIFGVPRTAKARWRKLIRWIDTSWSPLQYDPAPFFAAFPLRKAVR